MGIQPWGTPRGPYFSFEGAQPHGGTGCHWVPVTVALGPSLCPQGTQSHCTDVSWGAFGSRVPMPMARGTLGCLAPCYLSV